MRVTEKDPRLNITCPMSIVRPARNNMVMQYAVITVKNKAVCTLYTAEVPPSRPKSGIHYGRTDPLTDT